LWLRANERKEIMAMRAEQSLRSNLNYGRRLVKSGVAGLFHGRDEHLQGQALSQVLTRSMRASLALTALGAGTGLLRYYLPARRARLAKTIASGFAGGAIGFALAFAWKTRGLAESMSCSAVKQMNVVRDQHWLDRHPIDYA
jgi:hypothetical protein